MSAGGGAGGHLAQYCVRQSAVFFNVSHAVYRSHIPNSLVILDAHGQQA